MLSRNDLNPFLGDPEPFRKQLNEGYVRFALHRRRSQLHLEEVPLIINDLIC